MLNKKYVKCNMFFILNVSCVVYKFTCNSIYVGETCRHISTRSREHLFTDKNSHIFKHLKSSKACKDSCSDSCFKIIDSAKTYNQLKIKEALHILWEGPNLNKQVQHYNFSLTFYPFYNRFSFFSFFEYFLLYLRLI